MIAINKVEFDLLFNRTKKRKSTELRRAFLDIKFYDVFREVTEITEMSVQCFYFNSDY